MKNLLFILLLLPTVGVAQGTFNVDSLRIELETEKDEETRLHLRNLIGEYGEIGRYGYWDSIIHDAEKSGFKAELLYASFMQSLNYSKKSILDEAIFYTEKALTLSIETKDSIWMGYAIEHLGHLNGVLGEKSTALSYFKQAHNLYLTRKDQWRIGHVLIRIAEFHQENNELDESMGYYRESVEMFKNNKDTSGLTIAYNHIGRVFREKEQLDSALFYMYKSLDLRANFEDQYYLPYTLNDLALTHFELGNLDTMFSLLERSEKEVKRIGDNGVHSQELYDLYLKYYREKNDYKNALKYKDLSVALRDSVNHEENQKAAFKQQSKFEYETQKAIDDAENDKILAVEKEKQQKQFVILVIIIHSGALVLILLVVIYRRLRITKKQKVLIEEQKHQVESQKQKVEEAHKEITDSINYAKRIQSAILPPGKLVKKYLNESFILYKPKDVVAGDFYWLEHKDKKTIFAAADCTGHGVPGAMVSVICNNGLNRSVREYGLTEPGEILDKTRELVIQEFEKSEEEVKDGMDIALCSIEGSTLKYAGANNPLWIIRDCHPELVEGFNNREGIKVISEGNTHLLETKASKQPIGKYMDPKPFTTHVIELQKGDTIYIFSDGYVDQFGGEKGKKFKPANLRKLLLSIQDQSMKKQKTLLDEAFETWRGDLEQIDDVCIIGVRV